MSCMSWPAVSSLHGWITPPQISCFRLESRDKEAPCDRLTSWPESLLFFFLVALRGMQDLSSPTRDWTHAPCSGSAESCHWTTREVPRVPTFIFLDYLIILSDFASFSFAYRHFCDRYTLLLFLYNLCKAWYERGGTAFLSSERVWQMFSLAQKDPSWGPHAFMAFLGLMVEGCVCLLWSLLAEVLAPSCEFPQHPVWFHLRECPTLYLPLITYAAVRSLNRLEASRGPRSCHSYFCGFTWHVFGAQSRLGTG